MNEAYESFLQRQKRNFLAPPAHEGGGSGGGAREGFFRHSGTEGRGKDGEYGEYGEDGGEGVVGLITQDVVAQVL